MISKLRKKTPPPGLLSAGLLLFLTCGCTASPDPALWPPKSGEASYRADVIAHGLHTFIVLYPDARVAGDGYAEYGFAEKAWYLDGEQGVFGAFRALFWPSESVVEVSRTSAYPFFQPYEEVRTWRFVLTQKGRDAMIRFLESWTDKNKTAAERGGKKYHTGRYGYHLFRGCHHYTAGALRSAGLPVRPWWAFSRRFMAMQLDKSEQFQTVAGIHPEPEKP